MTFVNDVALTHSGSAYFTDAMNPELYRVFPNCEGGCEFGRFLGFEGTVLEYGKGLNLNDMAASEDGRYLVSIYKSSTGKLYRIDAQSKGVSLIEKETRISPMATVSCSRAEPCTWSATAESS